MSVHAIASSHCLVPSTWMYQAYGEVNSRLQTTDAEASSTPLKPAYFSPKVKPVLRKDSGDRSSQQARREQKLPAQGVFGSWEHSSLSRPSYGWFHCCRGHHFIPACLESEGILVDSDDNNFVITQQAKQQSILRKQKPEFWSRSTRNDVVASRMSSCSLCIHHRRHKREMCVLEVTRFGLCFWISGVGRLSSPPGQGCSRSSVAERSWNLRCFHHPCRSVLSRWFPPPDPSSLRSPPRCRSAQHKRSTERSLSSACTAKSTSLLHWLKARGCVLPPHPGQLGDIFYFWPHTPAFPLQLHRTFNPALSWRTGED